LTLLYSLPIVKGSIKFLDRKITSCAIKLSFAFSWLSSKVPGLEYFVDVVGSILTSLLRGFAGYFVVIDTASVPRPKERLQLFDIESCACCRLVRETLSMLDLDVTIYPCPPDLFNEEKRKTRYRKVAKEIGTRTRFPLLVDPNTRARIYDSHAVTYLWATYGSPVASKPLVWRLPLILNKLISVFAGIFRPELRHGRGRISNHWPTESKYIELWSCESSPESRLVRETLTILEIPFVLHNAAHGSLKRSDLAERGKLVPYLEDPNTDFSSDRWQLACRYLLRRYGAKSNNGYHED